MPASLDTENPIRLERSMLFVPAAHWSMIEKAATSAADAVCLDLEDSVAPAEKSASRANIIRAFTTLDFAHRLRMFRINGLDTPFAYRDLIEVVETAGNRFDLVMIPKVASPKDVMFVDRLLTQIEMGRSDRHPVGIEAQIETASGFVYVREIAQSSPRLEALVFGPEDYAASMQMPSSAIGEFEAQDKGYPGHRWHTVMHSIVAAARANGLRCLDGPYADYKDTAGFERTCRIAFAMGFEGKQCIHPSQVATANAMFTPSLQEVAQAEAMIRIYEQSLVQGRGVASLNNKMIDAASVRMARLVVERYRLSRPR